MYNARSAYLLCALIRREELIRLGHATNLVVGHPAEGGDRDILRIPDALLDHRHQDGRVMTLEHFIVVKIDLVHVGHSLSDDVIIPGWS